MKNFVVFFLVLGLVGSIFSSEDYCYEDENIENIRDEISSECYRILGWFRQDCKLAIKACADYQSNNCCKCYVLATRERCFCYKNGGSFDSC
jgi:hypothetical protein